MNKKRHILFIGTLIMSMLLAYPFIIKKIFHCSNNEDVVEKMTEQQVNEKPVHSLNTKENQKKTIFTKVDHAYFDDALFIGDSRTVGIQEYGKLDNATYFADVGMSSYNLYSKKISVPHVGKLTLKELLSSKKYHKIYIMLGINEIGYRISQTVEVYQGIIHDIQQYQPDAFIFIEANLHVGASRNQSDSIVNNIRIDKFNQQIAKMADQQRIFYLDVNEIFDDSDGCLSKDYTFDGTHVLAKYYVEWTNWLKEHGVV